MKQDWNADLYLNFENDRTQPAVDLARRISNIDVASVVDLGCGPGNSTEVLRRRFPNAVIEGIDSSAAMIEAARARLPKVQFSIADVRTWTPDRPVDVLFSNAVFHWVPDRLDLCRRLIGHLKPGGALAVQMPDNMEEPVHRLMRETAESLGLQHALMSAEAARSALEDLSTIYDRLMATAARVELWRTTYVHSLKSPDSIIEWVQSTGLRPYLEPLSEPEQRAFLEGYRIRIEAGFPRQRDGRVLMTFPRLFILAIA